MTDFPKYIFIDDLTIKRTYAPNIIRSEMETGPNKTRPINSVPLFYLSFEIAMPVGRFKDFNQWFHNDLRSGALWFLLHDPIDGTRRRFRFFETEIEWSKAGNLMRTAIVIEGYDEL